MVQPKTICHPFITQHFLDPGSGDVLERSRVSWTEYGAHLLCGEKQRESITCLHSALVVSSKRPEDAAVQFNSKWRRSSHVYSQNIHDSIPDRSHDHVSEHEIRMILTQQAFPIFHVEIPFSRMYCGIWNTITQGALSLLLRGRLYPATCGSM